MKVLTRVPLLGLLVPLLLPNALNADFIHAASLHQGRYAHAEEGEGLKYAPDRGFDLLHQAIDVTPDFKARSLKGQTSLRLKPIAKPLAELKLDAVKLDIATVTASTPVLGWHSTDSHVVITFEPPVPVGKDTTVTLTYSGSPTKGMYFRTPEMGYTDTHLFTQGESIETRHWVPCFDSPNEKFTTEVTCRVPEHMVVLSNGKKVSTEKDPASDLMAVRWLQDKPHVTYLIALAAGEFKSIEDRYGELPVSFFTPASQIQYATNSFAGTKDMLGFFEQEIGVPYPWDKYYQVCVDDFVAGGMENTSLTILTADTLHPDGFETLRDSAGLVAHELAHQWFGDLVTCKDWANLWLNEGFATYYESLYDGHRHGRDEFLYSQFTRAEGVLGVPNQTNAIVRRDYGNPSDQFSFLTYPKAACVLHMLRCELGPELYRNCVKTFLERHRFGVVTTEDFNAVIQELSGRSFDRFFDQWIYHAGYPELTVNYTWDERLKLAKLSVQQTQKLSEDVLLFHVPLAVRFKTPDGLINQQVQVTKSAEDFYFPLPAAPVSVRLDPEIAILAKITFTPPSAMLQVQLADTNDVVGRILAVRQLGNRKDADSVKQLKKVLNTDPFYGVRMAAAQALRGNSSDEARAALLDSIHQPDARVRRDVVRVLGSGYHESSRDLALKLLDSEKNPDIQAAALGVLSAYGSSNVNQVLLKFLRTPSFRNILADAAIGAMRTQDDPVHIEPIRKAVQEQTANFTSGGLGRALNGLAFLARNLENKDPIRELLLEHINSHKRRVQTAVLTALGTLGDPKAAPVLETFTSHPKGSPENRAAEKSLADLREGRKAPAPEPAGLRSDIQKIQRENQDIRKELEDLKKKLEALKTAPADPSTPAPAEEKEKTKPQRGSSKPQSQPARAPKEPLQ